MGKLIYQTDKTDHLDNIKGFTLIELLIAMAILSVITVLIVNNFSSQSNDHATQNQVVEMHQNLRGAMYMITKEIRKAGYDPDDTGNYGIIQDPDLTNNPSINSFSFTYYDDTTASTHTATINLFDSNIDIGASVDEIQITAAGGAIAGNITALVFQYLDENNTPIPFTVPPAVPNIIPDADLDDIRAVKVTITASPDERERSMGIARTLSTTVKCRNLGL